MAKRPALDMSSSTPCNSRAPCGYSRFDQSLQSRQSEPEPDPVPEAVEPEPEPVPVLPLSPFPSDLGSVAATSGPVYDSPMNGRSPTRSAMTLACLVLVGA